MTAAAGFEGDTVDADDADGNRRFRLAYSPAEVAAALGISRELVDDLVRTEQLGSVKAGRRRLISRKHLDDFLAGDTACAECQTGGSAADGRPSPHHPGAQPMKVRRVG
jgi:excisionase family DNA binding protein